ncbi:ABC transporter substrate-binding protein [Roseomonas sp. AR75]|uniref:ABC transporter substrate-binding protein n=1 Tax=Roseomonas sp. AR75 TaxID=2562311 RepID=UPI0010BFAC77|nr:ABC transporter substrate-binding protein [Roseomonas sp. AR75]
MTDISRRQALLGAGVLLAAPRIVTAQSLHRVRFTLDWVFHGSYSFAAAGERNGIFRNNGVDFTINRGFGSGRVPIDIAAGTYDIGIGDMTPAIRFMAENPQRDIVAVAIVYDQSPACCTVRADGPITDPKMLAGKTLAAPEFDGGRQIFPVFARAVGIDASTIRWNSISPELREPMLVQRRADGITGFITSTGLSLKALGMDWPQQRIFRYKNYGMDFYGSGLITTRTFLRERPEAARAAIKAILQATIWAYRNPAEAITFLKQRETLTDVAIETERQQVTFDEMMISDTVKRHGLSYFEPARAQKQIQAIVETFSLPRTPSVDQVFDGSFLPPASELQVATGA